MNKGDIYIRSIPNDILNAGFLQYITEKKKSLVFRRLWRDHPMSNRIPFSIICNHLVGEIARRGYVFKTGNNI